jgi:FkbM family methyltransferase
MERQLQNKIKIHSGVACLQLALARRAHQYVKATRDSSFLPPHVAPLNDIVGEEMIVVGAYEKQLLSALFGGLLRDRLHYFNKTTALDVGANIGNHSLYFSKFFERVIAVEPNPRALCILEANVKLSGANITVAPIGLSESSGRLHFQVNEQGNLGASGFDFAGVASGTGIECEVSTGDDLLARSHVTTQIGLIKLDIEGAELFALRGLARTLDLDAPVVAFECHTALGPNGGAEIFKFLRTHKYSQFYEIRSTVLGAPGGIRTWIRRLFQGELVFWDLIEEVEDRTYLMIVALVE